MVGQTAADPDGLGSLSSPITTFQHDILGNLLTTTDPLSHTTTNVYDHLGRKTQTTDANNDTTTYTYDPAGRMTSLTDASGNTTAWVFDANGQVIEETITVNSVPLSRYFSYDAAGNLVEKTDRNGRVTRFTYDNLLRQTTEAWYDDTSDTTANLTYSTTYDTASRVASVGDGNSEWTWDYDVFGNVATSTQNNNALAGPVTIDSRYDAAGRRTRYDVDINGADDFINEYDYDALGRVVKIKQSGVAGGNAVAEKRVDFSYNDDGTRSTLTRYADLKGNEMVAATDQIFDELGRIESITHDRASTLFADYDFAWDAASRITEIDMAFLDEVNNDTATYDYDNTSQLTDADYADATQSNEDYSYDSTGNRTMTGYDTGDHNRLLCDGTNNYTYDNEGNFVTEANISESTSVVYEYDHRNRMTRVTFKDASGTPTKIVEYAYDANNRMYKRTLDVTADGTIDDRSIFVYQEENDQIVLELADDNVGSVTASDVAKRLLFGPEIDQILVEEHVGDDTYYLLTDHLNTVRDVLTYNGGTGIVSLAQHNEFNSFGAPIAVPTVKTFVLYTARPYDYDAGLQDNLNRKYDALTARWTSEDPIGFQAGDVNLYRYVGNCSPLFVDPPGLYTPLITGPSFPWSWIGGWGGGSGSGSVGGTVGAGAGTGAVTAGEVGTGLPMGDMLVTSLAEALATLPDILCTNELTLIGVTGKIPFMIPGTFLTLDLSGEANLKLKNIHLSTDGSLDMDFSATFVVEAYLKAGKTVNPGKPTYKGPVHKGSKKMSDSKREARDKAMRQYQNRKERYENHYKNNGLSGRQATPTYVDKFGCTRTVVGAFGREPEYAGKLDLTLGARAKTGVFFLSVTAEAKYTWTWDMQLHPWDMQYLGGKGSAAVKLGKGLGAAETGGFAKASLSFSGSLDTLLDALN